MALDNGAGVSIKALPVTLPPCRLIITAQTDLRSARFSAAGATVAHFQFSPSPKKHIISGVLNCGISMAIDRYACAINVHKRCRS